MRIGSVKLGLILALDLFKSLELGFFCGFEQGLLLVSLFCRALGQSLSNLKFELFLKLGLLFFLLAFKLSDLLLLLLGALDHVLELFRSSLLLALRFLQLARLSTFGFGDVKFFRSKCLNLFRFLAEFLLGLSDAFFEELGLSG